MRNNMPSKVYTQVARCAAVLSSYVICKLLLQGWQLPNGFSSVRNIYTNLHTKTFLLKHGKFEKKLTLEGH